MAMYTVTISSAGSPDVVSLTDGSTFATLAVSAGRGPKGDGWTGVSYDTETGRFTFTSNDGLGYVSDDITVDLNAAVQAAESAQQAAESAEQNTINLFDQFGDQYLGPKASDPIVDNDGDPLTEGDIYFNTTDEVLKFYSGTAWVAPEVIATTAASEAETSANNAATSEQNAATSEQNAAGSATDAQNAQNAAEAAFDSFDDRYLGSKTTEPTTDNDGDPLLEGAIYWSSTNNALRIYGGTEWVDAAFNAEDFMVGSNNLSDVDDVTASRTNLGLGTAAVQDATAFASSAQGDLANTAVQPGDSPSFGSVAVTGTVDGRDIAADGSKLDGIESGATADQTAGEIKIAYESNADTNAFTDADQSKLLGIEAGADVTDTANVTAAGALMDSEVTNLADVKAFDPADYATSAQGDLADTAVQPNDSPTFGSVTVTGTVDGRDVAADGSKLDGIEANADVTDTANVTAAGALMDSEVANLAAVKSFDPTDYVNQTSATGSAELPAGTTAERDGTPSAGYLRFNSTDGAFEGYDGVAWGSIGGADFSSVGESILPSVDVTYNLGSSTFKWQTGYFANISDGTTSVGTEYVVNGSAKAWVNFNGTGTIATRDSFNVSSLTDNGTGYYTVSFTNSMSNGNYSVSSASANIATNTNRHVGPTAYSVGSVDVRSQNDIGAPSDVLFVNVATCGDLA